MLYPDSTLASHEPLLLDARLRPSHDLTRGEVNLIFGVLGLSSSVLWNQIMLSTGLLVSLFGEHAISIAATAQNLLCATAMWLLTFAPASVAMKARGSQDHRTRQLMLAVAMVMCMLLLGVALCVSLLLKSLPLWLLIVLVAFDGAATGTAQVVAASLGGMLSGSSSEAAGALLLGEAAAPLLTALCSALVSLQPVYHDAYSSTLATLLLPMAILGLALLALRRLQLANPPGGVPAECKTLGIETSSHEGAARISARLRALLPNALCVGALCVTWIFFLCSTPYIAVGMCGATIGGDCERDVVGLMIGVSNVAAFIGRLLGGVLPPNLGTSWPLIVETCAVIGLSFGAVLSTEALSIPVRNPQAVGGAMSAVLTLWCNALLMRLSAAAQRSAGEAHGILCPCPYTAQVSWVALQTGCVVGAVLPFVVRAHP